MIKVRSARKCLILLNGYGLNLCAWIALIWPKPTDIFNKGRLNSQKETLITCNLSPANSNKSIFRSSSWFRLILLKHIDDQKRKCLNIVSFKLELKQIALTMPFHCSYYQIMIYEIILYHHKLYLPSKMSFVTYIK